MVERQLGNLDGAEALAREALEIGHRIGDEFTRPFAISGLAAIATERREFERAATLVGAAEAIMEAQHMAWPPDERPHYERLLAALPEGDGFRRLRSSPQPRAVDVGERGRRVRPRMSRAPARPVKPEARAILRRRSPVAAASECPTCSFGCPTIQGTAA